MNKVSKIKKVCITLAFLINYALPAYGLYASWEYATSFFSKSDPEITNNNNAKTPAYIHQSKKFLIAGTATQTKADNSNNIRFKTPLIQEPINNQNYWLFGLFDGIGGDMAAELIKNCILSKIRFHAQENMQLHKALQAAVNALHEEILTKDQLLGSSLLFAIIDKNKHTTLAHAGDSLAVLKTTNKHFLLTEPHILKNESETARIHASFVHTIKVNPKPYLSSYTPHGKAIAYEASSYTALTCVQPDQNLCACDPFKNTIRPNTSYTSRTTRGVGQALFVPNFISTLDIQEIKYNHQQRFLILGTGSFWDVISPQAAVDIVEDCIEQEICSNKQLHEKNICPQLIAQILVDHAWSMINYKAPQPFDSNQDYDLNLTHDHDMAVTVILFTENIYTQVHY